MMCSDVTAQYQTPWNEWLNKISFWLPGTLIVLTFAIWTWGGLRRWPVYFATEDISKTDFWETQTLKMTENPRKQTLADSLAFLKS